MFKKIIEKGIAIVVLCFVLTTINEVKAQYSLSTPYSRYGIGVMADGNASSNLAMGGIGQAIARNNEVNFTNPASYTAIDTQSFVFNIGFNAQWRNMSSNVGKTSAFLAGVNNLSVAFPILRNLKMAMSLMPVSDMDYRATDSVFSTMNYIKTFEGDGGINKFAVGLAYQAIKTPTDNLSVGLNGDYHFGSLERVVSLKFLKTVPDEKGRYNDTIGFANTRTQSSYSVKGFTFDIGVQYFHSMNNGNILGTGITFSPSFDLHADNTDRYFTYYSRGTVDTLQDIVTNRTLKSDIRMPMRISGGLSFERPHKIFAEVDFNYTKWSDFDFEGVSQNDVLKDNLRLNAGLEYIPNAISLNYFERLAYRVGFNYDNGYIFLQDKRINRFGISFGVALPIKKLGTTVNLNCEYGSVGTKDNNLIKENYFRIGISVSAKDRWFVQRKYQ